VHDNIYDGESLQKTSLGLQITFFGGSGSRAQVEAVPAAAGSVIFFLNLVHGARRCAADAG
jgi:hypothetical protein